MVAVVATLAGGARADSPRGVADALKDIPEYVPYGIVCSVDRFVTMSPWTGCYTPIGLGEILYTQSNGRFVYAMVRSLSGDDLCFAGPVEDVEANVKIAPAPGRLNDVLILGCMKAFGQLDPVPKQAFVLWY